MEQHIWKVKLVILWVFQVLFLFSFMFISFIETESFGVIKLGGSGTPISIILFIICMLAWLSFVAKPTITRWLNIVFGLLIFISKIIQITGLLVDLSLGLIIIDLLGAVSAALIFWYGWKIPKQSNPEIT